MEGIERSPSSRASCRVCKQGIARDDWRYFEEEVSGDFDGDYRRHWHLHCAVERRSAGASRALSGAVDLLPRLQWGQLLCQAVLNRCRKYDLVVSRPLWLTLDEDGWAHLLCELDSGRFAVVTDLNGGWAVSVEGSRDDALAVLPGPIFEIAVMALARQSTAREAAEPRSGAERSAQDVTARETRRTLTTLQKRRAVKARSERKALGAQRRAATLKAKEEARAAGGAPPTIARGTRVKIVGDVRSTRGTKGQGVCGEVFWCGYGNRGTEKRVGLKGDNGDTYWADVSEVRPVARRGRGRR